MVLVSTVWDWSFFSSLSSAVFIYICAFLFFCCFLVSFCTVFVLYRIFYIFFFVGWVMTFCFVFDE
ncbi:hypothetical protein HOY80DRAFT_983281 [Tuber brumale]|nr:hypothetical protein HOY80DRAFT_983281 [Tuber brumale]